MLFCSLKDYCRSHPGHHPGQQVTMIVTWFQPCNELYSQFIILIANDFSQLLMHYSLTEAATVLLYFLPSALSDRNSLKYCTASLADMSMLFTSSSIHFLISISITSTFLLSSSVFFNFGRHSNMYSKNFKAYKPAIQLHIILNLKRE